MNQLGGICAFACAFALTGVYFFQWGRESGRKDGYEQRRKDEEEWWIKIDQQVDRERVKMWRDEG
jgi:hypothetical protein